MEMLHLSVARALMFANRAGLVARMEMRIILTNRGVWITLLTPIGMLYVLAPAFELQGAVSGDDSPVTRAAAAIAAMWVFFLFSYSGFSFLRERMWHTWDRLRLSGATQLELYVGKGATLFAFGVLHQFVTLLGAAVLFDFSVIGAIAASLTIGSVYVVVVLGIAFAMVGFFRTLRSFGVAQSVAIMIGGAAAGAITPQELLPSWIVSVSRILPNYWAQRAYTPVLRELCFRSSIVPLLVLGSFGAVSLLAAYYGALRHDRPRSWV